MNRFFAAAFTLWMFCFAAGLSACDGEWHRGGYPQWSGISFSESNYPDLSDEDRPRPVKKNRTRKKKVVKREKPNLVLEHDFMEDDGLIKENKSP